MLLPNNFIHDKDSFFNEDSESAPTTPESITNNSSSRSSRKRPRDEKESDEEIEKNDWINRSRR